MTSTSAQFQLPRIQEYPRGFSEAQSPLLELTDDPEQLSDVLSHLKASLILAYQQPADLVSFCVDSFDDGIECKIAIQLCCLIVG